MMAMKGRFINPISLVCDLVWPPTCFGCDKIIPLSRELYTGKNHHRLALCEKCLKKFDEERFSLCPRCDKAHLQCHCRPVDMPGNLSGCIHISRYTEWSSVTDGIILAAKSSNYKYLYELISDNVAKAIRSRVPDYRNAVLTSIPRSKTKVKKTGVDQARLAAKMAAKKLGIDYVDTLTRVSSAEQKGLSAKARLENAYSAYRINKRAVPRVAGKSMILYDDVLTSGATMSAGSDLLYEMGASKVFALAFAMRFNDNLVDRRKEDILYGLVDEMTEDRFEST